MDEFAALGPQVKGAGNRERYDYWLNTFLYLRAVGEANCAWGEYNRVMEKVKQQKDAAAQREMARQLALPLRVKLVRLVGVVFDHLLATVSTTGELGTVANWNQHNLPGLLTKPGEELAKILGEPLPADAQLTQSYHGPTADHRAHDAHQSRRERGPEAEGDHPVRSPAARRHALLAQARRAPVCQGSAEVGSARGLLRPVARGRER